MTWFCKNCGQSQASADPVTWVPDDRVFNGHLAPWCAECAPDRPTTGVLAMSKRIFNAAPLILLALLLVAIFAATLTTIRAVTRANAPQAGLVAPASTGAAVR